MIDVADDNKIEMARYGGSCVGSAFGRRRGRG